MTERTSGFSAAVKKYCCMSNILNKMGFPYSPIELFIFSVIGDIKKFEKESEENIPENVVKYALDTWDIRIEYRWNDRSGKMSFTYIYEEFIRIFPGIKKPSKKKYIL